jgi:hypothetical protein
MIGRWDGEGWEEGKRGREGERGEMRGRALQEVR